MEITVDMSHPMAVEVGATGLRGLSQEIRTVLGTARGSVPLDWDFGVAWDTVDLPMPQVLPLLVADIVDALEKNVPRIRVTDVQFSSRVNDTQEGLVFPIVTVEIREEYLHEFR